MSWYAVQTRSNCEGRVHSAFERDGVEDLYPFYRYQSKWSDRQKVIERPVFPGYLFACFGSSAGRIQVLSTTGVIRILGAMLPVPDREIDQVRQLMASPESLSAALPALYAPAKGDEVEIAYGPFVGLAGRITRVKGKLRVWVSIPSMMAGVPVEVDAQSLRKVRRAA
ncbi:MAG: UpxY family transcription antiterminator [Patescibacteria group bacterium]|nr:UpxY family transcription antiterminator [Patescibacteria group bacterium]